MKAGSGAWRGPKDDQRPCGAHRRRRLRPLGHGAPRDHDRHPRGRVLPDLARHVALGLGAPNGLLRGHRGPDPRAARRREMSVKWLADRSQVDQQMADDVDAILGADPASWVIHDGKRSDAQQWTDYAQGRTAPGPIITYA